MQTREHSGSKLKERLLTLYFLSVALIYFLVDTEYTTNVCSIAGLLGLYILAHSRLAKTLIVVAIVLNVVGLTFLFI